MKMSRFSISASRVCCLLVLAGMVGTPAFAQSPAVQTSQVAWTQDATSTELPQLTFASFVDGARTPLASFNCVASATVGKADCSAPVPAMTPGLHAVELIAIRTIPGTPPVVLESAKSAPLQILLVIAPAPPTGLRIVR